MIVLLGILLASTATFCAVIGDFGWQNLLIGFVLSLALMYLFRKQVVPQPLAPVGLSMHILIYAPVLLYYLLVDIFKGTWQVARITLGIDPLRRPGIIKYPLGTLSRYGAGPVGFFITLSPGSFLVDIDWEERVMLVHVLDASDPEALRRDAERYYRLWEYGDYSPREITISLDDDTRDEADE